MEKLETYLIAAGNPEGKEPKQKILRRKRAGDALTREQIRAIRKGRKLLRKEMRKQGLKDRSDFELTAANMGLYFDKPPFILWWRWFLHGRALWALLAAMGALLATLFIYSSITQLQGHFTINMSSGMFRQGFLLSETADFANPTTHLFCTPAENIPCISIGYIPEYVDSIDGAHNETYFAYTFYCRNEGDATVDYEWQINLNSESGKLSSACWVMVFEDGEMTFYAAPNTKTGKAEMLPAADDNSRGYINMPLGKFNKNPDKQYQIIKQERSFAYTRVIPELFAGETVVAQGTREDVMPGQIDKYTVVIWLEGDDPDCTDDLIGGHVGMDVYFAMTGEESDASVGQGAFSAHWDELWENLKFWKD